MHFVNPSQATCSFGYEAGFWVVLKHGCLQSLVMDLVRMLPSKLFNIAMEQIAHL